MDSKTKKTLIIAGVSLLVVSVTLGLVFGLKKDKDDKGGDENGGDENGGGTTPPPTPDDIPVVTTGGDTISIKEWGEGTFPIQYKDRNSMVAKLQVALNKKFKKNNKGCNTGVSDKCDLLGMNIKYPLGIDGKFGDNTSRMLHCLFPEYVAQTTSIWTLWTTCEPNEKVKLDRTAYNKIMSGVTLTSEDKKAIEDAEKQLLAGQSLGADGIGGYFSANGDYKEHRFAFGGNSETRENLAGWKDSDHQSEFWMSK
jgi:hypothetical protein